MTADDDDGVPGFPPARHPYFFTESAGVQLLLPGLKVRTSVQPSGENGMDMNMGGVDTSTATPSNDTGVPLLIIIIIVALLCFAERWALRRQRHATTGARMSTSAAVGKGRVRVDSLARRAGW